MIEEGPNLLFVEYFSSFAGDKAEQLIIGDWDVFVDYTIVDQHFLRDNAGLAAENLALALAKIAILLEEVERDDPPEMDLDEGGKTLLNKWILQLWDCIGALGMSPDMLRRLGTQDLDATFEGQSASRALYANQLAESLLSVVAF